MNIVLNGQVHEISSSTLDELLDELEYTDSQVATAVNGEFVQKTQRNKLSLNEGDRVEVIAPMAGG